MKGVNSLKSSIFRPRAFALIILISYSLSGCWAISDPDSWPDNFIRKDTLPELVGKQEAEVVEKIGSPTYVYRKFDSFSYLYESLEDDTAMLMVGYFPTFIFGEGVEVSCVLLNFDGDGVLRDYQTKSAGAAYQGGYGPVEGPDCLDLFSVKYGDLVPSVASEKPYIAHNQWLSFWSDPTSDRLYLLCRAADKGHPPARHRLGEFYEKGGMEFFQDYAKAYHWYKLGTLVEGDYLLTWSKEALKSLRTKMSPDQISEGERLFTEWQPGQCERDLPRSTKPVQD